MISKLFKFKNGLKSYLVLLLILVVVLAIIVVFKFSTSGAVIESRTTDFGLKDIGELITQEGYYTNVQVLKDDQKLFGITVPLTTSKYIYSYSGKVTAGLDFSKIEVEVDDDAKTVNVLLPEVALYDVNIDNDSLKVYDESQSIFTPLSIKDVNDSQIALKEEVRTTALEQGILESAATNAKALITGILSASYDPSAYTITFEEVTSE